MAAFRAWDNVVAVLSEGELFQILYAFQAKVFVLNLVGGGIQFEVTDLVSLFVEEEEEEEDPGRKTWPMGILVPLLPL